MATTSDDVSMLLADSNTFLSKALYFRRLSCRVGLV